MIIPVQLLHPKAKTPCRAYSLDAGADLYALDCSIEEGGDFRPLLPGERRLLRTGVAMAIPAGYYGRIAPRSGLAVKHGIDVLAGVVDSGFRNEVKVCLINLGSDSVSIQPGDRIAQLIIERSEPASFMVLANLDQTDRGTGGFGSTGTS